VLKGLTYTSVVLYLTVLYGQNAFEFGSDLRANFYFIGMAVVQSLIALILFKSFKNIATSYFLFMCIGEVFNQVLYNGDLSYIEIAFGLVGLIYILTKENISK
jgi:hypothetical protein